MRIALAVLLMIGFVGCNQNAVDPDIEKLGRATGPHAGAPAGMQMPAQMTPPPAVTQKVHKGKVLEVIDVPRYTYIRFADTNAQEKWAAVPTIEVKKDQDVTVQEQMTMANFKSPSLDRQFDALIFGTLEGQKAAGGMMGGGKMMGGKMGGMGGKMPAGHPPVDGQDGEAGAKPGMQGMPTEHPPINPQPQEGAAKPEGMPAGHPPIGDAAKAAE